MPADLGIFETKPDESGTGFVITKINLTDEEVLQIPEGVTAIAYNAIPQVNKVKRVILPASFRDNITSFLFGLEELTSIEVAEDNPVYSSVDGCLCRLNYGGLTLRNYPDAKEGEVYILPRQIRSVSNAFYSTKHLRCIVLHSEFEFMVGISFQSASLTEVQIDENNPKYISKDGCVLTRDGTQFIYFPSASPVTEYTLPEGVKRIGCAAFYENTVIRSVTVPEGVEKIDRFTFQGCANLTEITLPASLRSIGEKAFDGCKSLKRVIYALDGIMWDRIEIDPGNDILADCEREYLVEAFSKDSFIDEENLDEIMAAFEYEKDGDRLIIKKIKDSEVTEVHIPYGVTDIGDKAMIRCFDLRAIFIPDTVKRIGNEAFLSCSSLEKAEIPEGVESIGDLAFGCCHKLGRVELPSTLTTLGHAPFWSCESLVEIAVDPASVTLTVKDGNLYSHDGSTLIQYCVGKPETSFRIPDGVKVIGERAFECSWLTEIIFNGSEREIGVCAFCNCFHITALEIPASVKIFREAAFSYCTRLESVSVPGHTDLMEDDLFSHCDKLTRGAISHGSDTLDRCPLWYCDAIEELTLPSEIKSITTMSLMSGGTRSGFCSIRFLGDKKQWKTLLRSLDKGTVKLIKKSTILF